MQWPFEAVLDEIHEISSREALLDYIKATFESVGVPRFIYIFMPQDAHYSNNAIEIMHRGFTGELLVFPKQVQALARTDAGAKYMKLKAASCTTAFTERDYMAESLFTSANTMDDEATAVWDRGMSLIIPVQSAHSNTGFFCLPTDRDKRDLKRERKLQLLCHGFHQRYCELWSFPQERQITLTKREQEILLWVSLGKSNSVVAQIVGISKSTVDSHLSRIFLKIGVNDRVRAVIKAHEIGLLREDIIRTSKAYMNDSV